MIELIQFSGKKRKINIPQEVGTKYREFGILLLKDSSGSRVECIIHKCRENPKDITMTILQEWVQGRGEPATWKKLVEILEAIDLKTLATDIREVKL